MPEGSIEAANHYVPEAFTHLYHTEEYALLDDAMRASYNRLFGLRINEQFIQFEELFIGRLMPRLMRQPALQQNPALLAAVESVLLDEQKHSRMFGRFNHAVRPDIYVDSAAVFAKLSFVEQGLFRLALSMPGILPALLWLLLAMEELTTAISDALIGHPDASSLENEYLLLHRLHLQDEKRHVGVDRKLIQVLLDDIPAGQHGLNARLFRGLFGNILMPRRSTIHVIDQLTREAPELKAQKNAMCDAITRLPPEKAFPANLVTPQRLPVLYALTEEYPAYRLVPAEETA